jgi:hypothetical protein
VTAVVALAWLFSIGVVTSAFEASGPDDSEPGSVAGDLAPATGNPTQLPSATARAAPTRTPTSAPTAVPTMRAMVNAQAQRVVGTGGAGVAIRDECADDARAGGSIPEGTRVIPEGRGQGVCAGWLFVRVDETGSWVRDDYLEIVPTPTPTPRPPSQPLILEPGAGCSKAYSFMTYEGLVTNNTSQPLEDVEAVALYYTDDGTFVKSDSALIDYNPLLPGQSSPFSVISTDNPAITRCRVEFKEFFGGTIPHYDGDR